MDVITINNNIYVVNKIYGDFFLGARGDYDNPYQQARIQLEGTWYLDFMLSVGQGSGYMPYVDMKYLPSLLNKWT